MFFSVPNFTNFQQESRVLGFRKHSCKAVVGGCGVGIKFYCRSYGPYPPLDVVKMHRAICNVCKRQPLNGTKFRELLPE